MSNTLSLFKFATAREVVVMLRLLLGAVYSSLREHTSRVAYDLLSPRVEPQEVVASCRVHEA